MCRLLAAILISICFLNAQSVTVYTARLNSPQSVAIEAGVGIAGVTIGKSSMSDVVAMYGDNFKVIKHNEYSDEIRYSDLGLAFWYCQHDPEKRIFCIEVKPPCYGVTSKGIVIGESTIEDVFKLYGEPDEHYGEKYIYKGLQFYYESAVKEGEEPRRGTERRIISIDVVPLNKDSNFCDGI